MIPPLLERLTRAPWTKAAGPVGMGLTLGTVPPLIDVAVYGIGNFAYEYQPVLREFPWALHLPPRVLPWGETSVLWLTIALLTLAGVRAQVGWLRVAGLALGTWALIIVFLVLLPAGSVALSQRLSFSPSEWRNRFFRRSQCTSRSLLDYTRRASGHAAIFHRGQNPSHTRPGVQ